MITELIIRILCDTMPEKADIAYLFGQTADNQDSVLSAGIELAKAGKINRLAMFGPEVSGYPGSGNWLPIIRKECPNVPVTLVGANEINTLIESRLIVQKAKKKKWKKLIIVAPPFHQIRVFITAVSVTLEEYPQLKIYNYVGKTLPWPEEVLHSQGVLRTTRIGLIDKEMQRIRQYYFQGDLMDNMAVLKYLNQRDNVPAD